MATVLEMIVQTNETIWDRKRSFERRGLASNTLDTIMENAPSGSGFDSGTKILKADGTQVVFLTAFHHMNDGGYYTAWTEHKVIIRPNLALGYTMRITGKDYAQIKEYIGDVFTQWLDSEYRA
jgi:hypothetical protein